MINAPSVALEKVLNPGDSPGAVAWSPDGRLLATADALNRRIIIWDYATGKALHTILKTYFGGSSLAFTPDGRYVVTSAVSPKGDDNRTSISMIDINTGQIARNVDGPAEHPTHIATNIAQLFSISPKNIYAAVITQNMNASYLSIYDNRTWSLIGSHKLMRSDGQGVVVEDCGFNPSSGELVLIDISGGVEVWDASSDRLITSFQAFTHRGSALTFSPDGHTLALSQGSGFAEQPPDPDMIRAWDTSTWKMIKRANASSGDDVRIRSLSFSPYGRYVASLGNDGQARLWDGQSLSLINVIDDGGRAGVDLSFAPDSRHLAIARNNDVRIVTVQTR